MIMLKKYKLILITAVVFILLLWATAASAVSGAAFTTFNPSVDGSGKDVCKNSIINCNIYGGKEYVWLNGGPEANGLGPDGDYFFAVLVPGGQPDPNDGGEKNLSDDYDCYMNRTFTVVGGEVSSYNGYGSCPSPYDTFTDPHWMDSNTQAPDGCKKGNGPQACDGPDWQPPYIRLYPYADTTNPGGVYILAVCSLDDGYPVSPRDCKYDAFKVKEGRVTYDFMLDGSKIHDLDADGDIDEGEPGLSGWEIHINGTGFLGEAIDQRVYTDNNGYWSYQSGEYTFQGQDKPQTAHLNVCEVLQGGWVQSYPTPGCYEFDINPEGVTFISGLSFGNFMPFDITVCKYTDDYNSTTSPAPYEGWEVYLYQDGSLIDTQYTGSNGCYTWTSLEPGHSYAVEENDPLEWVPNGPAFVNFGEILSGDGNFTHTWINSPAQGCTPGFWQGGSPNGQAGGQWLWNTNGSFSDVISDPDWITSGGQGANPYNHTDGFCDYFGCNSGDGGENMWYYVNPNLWPNASDSFDKAARSLVAAYLNASWGVNYAYSIDELLAMWSDSLSNGDYAGLHSDLDAANNGYWQFNGGDGCPISASLN